MRTCLVILAVITLVSITHAAWQRDFPEYDEEYEDAKDKLRQAQKEAIKEESQPEIYDLANAPKLFEKFIKDYHKQYKDEAEHNMRYEIFVKTLKEINKVNTSPDASHTSGINGFADMSTDEFELFSGGIPDEE